jgi:type IV pilus assembly protein PilC
VFFRQLAVAARRDVPLDRVMVILADDPRIAGKDSRSLKAMAENVAAGKSLSAAMTDRMALFPAQTVEMIRQAEQCGRLPDALNGLAADYRYDGEARRTMRNAMSWPLAVIAVALVVFGILSIYVAPEFKSFYGSFGAQLPASTRRFIVFTTWFRHYWWGLLLAGAAAVYLYRRDHSGSGFAGAVRSIVFRVPFAGDYAKTLFTYRLASWLYLFRDDSSLQKLAIGHLAATTTVPRLKATAGLLVQELARGRLLSEALSADRDLSRQLALFARLAEAMKSQEEPFAQLRDLLESDAGYALARFERGLVQTLYAVLALAIGSLVLALYEPIFHLGLVI